MLISAAAVRPALRRGWARRLKREARSPCTVAAAASILGFSLDSFVSLIEPALGYRPRARTVLPKDRLVAAVSSPRRLPAIGAHERKDPD